jgi:hypothetical protein
MIDLKAYYRKSQGGKKRYDDFKRKKLTEIETHEVISRLGTNLTKSSKIAFSLLDSYFFTDLIEYLVYMSKSKKFFEDIHSKKKKSEEEIAMTAQSIVENTLCIVINVFHSESDVIARAFMDIVLIFLY